MKGVERVAVSAAILEEGDRVLICRRRGRGSSPGLWEFPGGKLEPGETAEACLRRECLEELGVEVQVSSVFHTVEWTESEREMRLFFYCGRIVSGVPMALDHEEIRWERVRSLEAYAFCAPDGEAARKLAAR